MRIGSKLCVCIVTQDYTKLTHLLSRMNEKVKIQEINFFVFDIFGSNLIHLAAQIGNVLILAKLLEYCDNVNVMNNEKDTPLHFAARKGQLETVSYLLDQGANPSLKNSSNFTASELAIEYSHNKVAEFIDKWVNY